MLFRLRHHAIVSGDYQQDEIYRGDARQHVFDKAVVARHIDKAHDHLMVRPAIDFVIGKADIDGQAAFFLFRQTIRIDPR